jgi:hypothetical protein
MFRPHKLIYLATMNERKSPYSTDSHVNITITTYRPIWQMYTLNSLMLFLRTAFTLCFLWVVFLGQACVPATGRWNIILSLLLLKHCHFLQPKYLTVRPSSLLWIFYSLNALNACVAATFIIPNGGNRSRSRGVRFSLGTCFLFLHFQAPVHCRGVPWYIC